MLYWQILSGILATLYGISKAFGLFNLRRESNAQRIMDALAVGIHAAWTEVVKPWLQAHDPEEKLPQDIRDKAEAFAIGEAAKVDPIIRKTPRRILRSSLKRALEETKRIGGI